MPAPRFVERRPMVVVGLVYVVMVALAAVFLRALGVLQSNASDPRTDSTAVIFAILLAPPFAWVVRHALRRPRMPGYPRRR